MSRITKLDLRKYPIPRVRHHVSPQSYLAAASQHIQPSWYPPPIAMGLWTEWFGNGAKADVLDIGCGRGGFLLQYALENPNKNVLGLEVRDTLVQWINGVVVGEKIENAHALWYSVANGLDWIPDSSITMATYLFADPWPKKRHHKRRAFTSQLLDELNRVLETDGILYLATDRDDVRQHQQDVIMEHGIFTLESVQPSSWPFDFLTDQQALCERKNIPYGLYRAFR